jgi:elongation factor Ts
VSLLSCCFFNQLIKLKTIITLNCETDFVGKKRSFVTLAKELVEKAINFSSKEEFLASDFNGMTVAEKLIEQTGVMVKNRNRWF